MHPKTAFIGITLLTTSLSAFASGGSMRCNDNLVSLGASEQEVINTCGEPAHQHAVKEEVEENITDPKTGELRRVTRKETVHVWTYDFGPNDFMRLATFRNGVLEKIELGGRGSKKE